MDKKNNDIMSRKLLAGLGKALVDFGKLVCASFVLGTVIKGDFSHTFVFALGLSLTFIFIFAGLWLNAKFGE